MGITAIRVLLADPPVAAVDHELTPAVPRDPARVADRIPLFLEPPGKLAVAFPAHGPMPVMRNDVLVLLFHPTLLARRPIGHSSKIGARKMSGQVLGQAAERR